MVTWRVSCPKCSFERISESLEEVFELERAHQRSERLSHVLEFERVTPEIEGAAEGGD